MVISVRETEMLSLKSEGIFNKLHIALMLHQKAIQENRNIDLINRLGRRIGRLVYLLENKKGA